MIGNPIDRGQMHLGETLSEPIDELRIIDDYYFYKAIEIIEDRGRENAARRRSPLRTNAGGLLSGLIYCGECGQRLTINHTHKVKTTSTFGQSTVSKILELVENASDKKARVENFITKFARWYTPSVVIAAVLLAVVPPCIFGIGSLAVWKTWIMRALVFLVVSCPCALVVSVPLSFFGGIGGASKDGILIKGAGYMEVLSKLSLPLQKALSLSVFF